MALPEGLARLGWRNIFTGEIFDGPANLDLGLVLKDLPVAILATS